MYRPEGWGNCYKGQDLFLTRKTALALRNGIMESAEDVYEAGADAMLEGLRAGYTVLYIPANQWFTSIPIIQPVSGAWVFIPDESVADIM